LRAAELAAFGMRGVGKIFAAYRDGILEDDDAVAVLHGPVELGYRPLTEALVNMHYTLVQAAEAGIVSTATQEAMIRIGKALHYKERSYKKLLACAMEQRLPAIELTRLSDWLTYGRIDQKRDDALALLVELQASHDPEPNEAHYYFEHTAAWEQFKAQVDRPDGEDARALDELRLAGQRYLDARQVALPSIGASIVSEPTRSEPALAYQSLSREDFTRLIRQQTQQRRLAGLMESLDPARVDWRIIHHLERLGTYSRYGQRARDKQAVLTANGFFKPSVADVKLTPAELVAWYFERLGRPLPDDITGYAKRLQFPTVDAFYNVLAGEYLYVHLSQSALPLQMP
jgi:hypothetical protein